MCENSRHLRNRSFLALFAIFHPFLVEQAQICELTPEREFQELFKTVFKSKKFQS